MIRIPRAFVAASALLLASGALSPAYPNEEEPVSIVLEASKSNSVPQGVPFKFVLKATNHSSASSETAAGTLAIGPVGDDTESVRFVHWSLTVPAGSVVRHKLEVNPPQWFAERGDFRVELVSDRLETEPLVFRVTRSPVQVPRFEDVTAEMGLETTIGTYSCGRWTAGAAWADVNDDGLVDLFLPRREQPPHLWVNTGSGFRDEAAARGVVAAGPMALGAVFGDYDNDGDQDLYVANDGPNVLFQNDGTGHFTDVTATAGVGNDGPTQSASWADYDADGDLDLIAVNYFRCPFTESYMDALYKNDGNGTFTEVTDLLEANGTTTGPGYQAAWFDYDGDRDVDLYLGNDFWGKGADPNHLWRNDTSLAGDSESFTDVSQATGSALAINTMGVGIGDFDRDLDLDIALSNIRAAHLLRNDGERFAEVGRRARVGIWNQDASTMSVTWGTEFVELNNDGWEDLYIAAGSLSSGELYQPNHVFTNQRNGRFLEHRAPSGADDEAASRAVVPADFDRDGRMDLYIVNNDGTTPRLYRNVTPQGRKHWLQVNLVGTRGARDGCGATAIVKLERARILKQLFCGGTSLGSSAERFLHYGLGRAGQVRKVVVWWPSSGKQVYRNVKVDRKIELRERS